MSKENIFGAECENFYYDMLGNKQMFNVSAANDSGRDLIKYSDDGSEIRYEIKGIHAFLTRNNDGHEPHGTIPFEMWTGNRNKNNFRSGWLQDYIDPWQKQDFYKSIGSKQQAYKPHVIAFVLVPCSDAIGIYPPCAVIEFDWGVLEDHLISICPWSLDPWMYDPTKQVGTYVNRIDANGIIGANWHVPLDKLSNIATVTIVKPFPPIFQTKQADLE